MDAPPLGFEHFDVETVEREPLTGGRDAPDTREHVAADRLEPVLVDRHAEAVGHRAGIHLRAEDVRLIVFTNHGLGFAVVFITDLADELLDDVLDRDEPGGAAVFVHDDGQLEPPLLELAQKVRARGFRYVDAPVTGLPDAAAAGTLTLLVGAEHADLDAARPAFATLATRILHFGPVGQGTVYKLMVNLLGAVQIASAAQGMALAESAGLDPRLISDAVSSGQAASPQVVRNFRRFLAGDHGVNVNFTPSLRLKDVEYALRLARRLGAAHDFGAVAATLYRKLCDAGYARDNESRIIDAVRRHSGK